MHALESNRSLNQKDNDPVVNKAQRRFSTQTPMSPHKESFPNHATTTHCKVCASGQDRAKAIEDSGVFLPLHVEHDRRPITEIDIPFRVVCVEIDHCYGRNQWMKVVNVILVLVSVWNA